MIVKCDQCQTRFKIPDEKVTEKGVKVRCTKCQHTFRVKKTAEAATVPAIPVTSAPEVDDPFSQFAAPFDGETRKMTSPTFAAQKDLPSELFEQPTRVAPAPALPPVPEAKRRTRSGAPAVAAPVIDASSPAFDFVRSPPPPPPPVPTGKPSARSPAPLQSKPSGPSIIFDASLTNEPGLLDIPPLDAPAQPSPAASRRFEVEESASNGPRSSTSWRGSDDEEYRVPAPERIELPSDPDRADFEMPVPAARPAAPSEPPPTTLGRIKLVSREAVESAPRQATPAPTPVPGTPVPARRSGVSELVLNSVFSLLLLFALITVGSVCLNEGKLELSTLSFKGLKSLVTENPALVTRDISNGLYDTRSGRPVFYVRGEVENRGAALRPVKIRAEILDGERLVRAAEGWAGAMPNPEELFALSTKEDLEELNVKLEKRAVPVPKGGSAPFAVAFHEYPPALSGLRLKVTVVEGAAPPTAAR
ncbi:MAG: zinc-ribbon domain-containing protein [Myxococcaceae bacterium]